MIRGKEEEKVHPTLDNIKEEDTSCNKNMENKIKEHLINSNQKSRVRETDFLKMREPGINSNVQINAKNKYYQL